MLLQAFKFGQKVLGELTVAMQYKPNSLGLGIDFALLKVPAFKIEFGF
jgi:hypothetical protein